MVSITVHLNFDYALFFIFCSLWQALIENGARSQISYFSSASMDISLNLVEIILRQVTGARFALGGEGVFTIYRTYQVNLVENAYLNIF